MEVFPLVIHVILCYYAATMTAMATKNEGVKELWRLRKGESLAAEKANDTFLVSPERTFSGGFRAVGTNAVCFSIWFAKSNDKTVVWTANRDSPVSLRGSRLTLRGNSDLVLTDPSGSTIWSSRSVAGVPGEAVEAVEARILETGNFVIIDRSGIVIWESFGHPTDTLLPSQHLVKNTTLVSVRSRDSYLSGLYNLKFDDDNVLNLVYDGPKISSVYWPRQSSGSVFGTGRTPYNSSRVAVLDDSGEFVSSDLLQFKAFDYSIGSKKRRRLTLDYDGVLRLYSLDEASGEWGVSWLPSQFDSCRVDGICGEYGICGYYNSVKPACKCPDSGFQRGDFSNWSKGCRPVFNFSQQSSRDFGFLKLLNTDYYGYDLVTLKFGISLRDCKNICINDTLCRGFVYTSDGFGQCFPKSFLINGFHMPNSQSVMYIKVPISILTNRSENNVTTSGGDSLRCSKADIVLSGGDSGSKKSDRGGYLKYLMAFVASFGIIEAICLGLWWWFIYRKRVNEEVVNMGYIALAMGFKKFGYSELKRATRNFGEEIGKGGFGSVYKGVLDDGRLVAVKRLEGVLQGDSEFWAEVSVIGNINHRNLAKMWGFCAESEYKLLVYEYVENSSLDKILFHHSDDNIPSTTTTLGLEQRYNVALGTAKGLSYLHEECLEWVLHCDVKPQNILLDDRLEPKVSDFGMSKLFKDVASNSEAVGFSRVRGTRGYLAPEWMMNLKIDAKADVYSYGVVLLELLTGKCVSNFLTAGVLDDGEHDHLIHWVTEKIRQKGLEGVMDRRMLKDEFDREKVERLLGVALLCVQHDRNLRPAMSKVVELLLETNEQA